MNVLSLCDGMSCGQIALSRIRVPVDKYYAAEIKKIAIKVTQENFPNTIQIGDVNKISYKDGVLYTEKGNFEEHFDLIMFGSPCQSFSIATPSSLRTGLADKTRSGLFLECNRIRQEVNPKYFFIENVASMGKENRNLLSEYLGVEAININSKLVSGALRNRLYWTNIPQPDHPLEDKGIKLQDVLTSGYTNREKARAIACADSRPSKDKKVLLYRYQMTGFSNIVWEEKGNDDSVRILNQTELERLQTVPEGYTKCLTRNQAANVLGDGWTIDVICYLLERLKEEF